jgi:hypothetical protein
MKFNATLNDVVKTDLEIGAVVALMGEPGIGKSSFVEGLATAMDTKAFVLACNQLADKADLTGGRLVPYDKPDGTASYRQVFYPHEVITAAIDYATANPREWPILFLDEINRTTTDVTSAALSLPTLRKIGSEDLPENLRIMVAGNNKGNVTMLDDASLSRFSIYNVEPDSQTLISVLGTTINPYVKDVLVRYPHLVFERGVSTVLAVDGTDDDDPTVTMSDLTDSGEEMLQLTTPRTIEIMSKWLNAVDPKSLQEYLQTQVTTEGRETTLLNELVEAKIGNTEFATHLVAAIAAGINSGTSAQIQALTAPKPNCYTSLKSAASVDDLSALISGLTEHEKSGALVYSLFERADNQILIEQLAQQVDALESDHTRMLITLAAGSALEIPNLEVFFNTGTTVGNTTKSVLSTFM